MPNVIAIMRPSAPLAVLPSGDGYAIYRMSRSDVTGDLKPQLLSSGYATERDAERDVVRFLDPNAKGKAR